GINKFRPENMERHWEANHPRHLKAVTDANDDGKDIRAVVETLIAAASSQKGALDAFVTTKKRIQPGKLSKELALLHFLIDNKIAFNVISSSSFDVLAKSWEVLLESKTTIQNLVPVMMELAVELMEDKIHSYPGVSCGVDLWT